MRVTIIGSGNVAYSLALALCDRDDCEVSQIYSRNCEKGKTLAKKVGAEFVASISELSNSSDIYIIAVKDGAIGEIIDQLERVAPEDSTICHTSAQYQCESGSRVARFYPLQTFSEGRKCDFSKITFFIEANSSKSEQNIITLCKIFGAHHLSIDREKLRVVHLAATFANNFTNRMYHYAEQILEKEGISREVLYPLISEGVEKLLESNTPARSLQTGAAARRDDKTIEIHRSLLEGDDEMVEIYNTISKAIYNDKF